MQNNVIVVYLALALRLLQTCLKQIGGMFVLRRVRAGKFGWGAISLGVDLDSARLDAVSRSLLWGSGIPIPEPVPAAYCLPHAFAPLAPAWSRNRDIYPPRHLT